MQKFAARVTTMAETARVINSLFGALGDPELISLGIGAPAKEALPVDIIQKICGDVMRADARGIEALQYGPVMGAKDLREVIAQQLLAPRGVHTDAEHIMVTTGGMETISLTCELFIDPGDIILVETPTFIHAVSTFEMFEAQCVGVEMDDDGMDTDDLEKKIRQYHPKMIYAIPTFQNPTGRTMPLARRKRLAELAAEYDVIVLEDDPYRDIRYSGQDLPPIKAFDTSDNVILCNSFSKIFSAGSRLGYMVAPDNIKEQLCNVKTSLNSHSSLIPQILCAEFFKQGYYPQHHKNICDLYRQRRDVMLECVQQYFPKEAKFTRPDGGLFVWAELPEGLNTGEILQEAVARADVKVSYVAGEKFFAGSKPTANCMRLSFGAVPPEKIRIATQRLGRLLCEKVERL